MQRKRTAYIAEKRKEPSWDVPTTSPRDVFRKAHMDGLIDAPDYWFTMIKYRNLTVHTYDEKFVDSPYQEFPQIISVMGSLIYE